MSFSPIGDILALTNVAFNLYNKGFLVIRDAPTEFRSLLRQLEVSRRLIRHVGHKIDQDGAFNNECTREVLEICSRTLYDFEALLAKYEKLGSSLLCSITVSEELD